MATPTLSLLAFPQHWDGTQLTLNVLVVPVGDPTAANTISPAVAPAPPTPAFAKATLALDARLITVLDLLPDAAAPHKTFGLGVAAPANRDTLYAQVEASFHLDPAPPPPVIRPALTSVKKHLPASYTSAFAFEQPRSPLASPDADFGCALRDPGGDPPKKKPPPSDLITWGKIISLCLRQPLLARALGLLYSGTITPDPADVAAGGWLYVALGAGSDYATRVTDGQIAYYAARLPPLTPAKQRSLCAAVLFPVTDTVGGIPVAAGNFDDVFLEAEIYDDGFTQVVHCSQPSVIDAASQDPDTLVAAADAGILIGWDDEQIPIWLQRQISSDPADVNRRVPLGVLGYRVDVRQPLDTKWHSLQAVTGNLTLGPIAISSAAGSELQVETAPAKLRDVPAGSQQDYWLPQYFTQWRGGSVVIADELAYRLSGAKEPLPARQLSAVPSGVDLRYGQTYEFRVRIADLTGGGPGLGDPAQNPAPAPVASWNFRRHVPPKSVIAKLPPPQPSALPSVDVFRPILAYPEFVFAGDLTDPATLLGKLAGPRDLDIGVPDPDVTHLQIAVQVRLPARDAGTETSPWRTLYVTRRDFPADSSQPFSLQLTYTEQNELVFAEPAPLVAGTGAVVVPTARDVRLRLTPVCKEDPTGTYFASDAVRTGLTFDIAVRQESSTETGLFVTEPDARRLNAIYLQPDRQATPNQALALALLGAVNPGGAVTGTSVIERLAAQLDLAVSGMTLSGRPGRRVVFGASGALRHTLASDHSSITFGSLHDLLGHWLAVIRLEIARDWTWDGLTDQGIVVSRSGAGVVGAVEVKRAVAATALQATPLRDHTELVFFDAIDPHPAPGEFPAELHPEWQVTATLDSAPAADPPVTLDVRLPITVPPAQVPAIASVGIALSEYQRAPDYSATSPRQRMLWIELAEPIQASGDDACFARVLAYAPDPLLVPGHQGEPAPAEPTLPIDPELIRIIIPGQSQDQSGLSAMQPLIPSSSPRHFLLPLPDGLDASSPELFGFFTYELRVGHAVPWSTAQGRFGRPLRITGVQHPAPGLGCLVNHIPAGIQVQTAFATPVLASGHRASGQRNLPIPQTQLWALLYTQVMQADGATHRNVLLDRRAFTVILDDKRKELFASRDIAGRTQWTQSEVTTLLATLCLSRDAPLSVLAVELLQEAQPPDDPLGADLGRMRILRTSPLVPVPAVCLPG